jgi:hypothetical protein
MLASARDKPEFWFRRNANVQLQSKQTLSTSRHNGRMQRELTREEFLGHAHTPLVNPHGDPSPGSPTKSTLRTRWRELRDWDIEAEATQYLIDMTDEDRNARMTGITAEYWNFVRATLNACIQPYMRELALRDPFGNAFRAPHNIAIIGASDSHAEIWGDASGLNSPPISTADLFFVAPGNKVAGIIELKPWWKVDETQIEQVRIGSLYPNNVELIYQAKQRRMEFTMAVLLSNKPTAI